MSFCQIFRLDSAKNTYSSQSATIALSVDRTGRSAELVAGHLQVLLLSPSSCLWSLLERPPCLLIDSDNPKRASQTLD